MALSRTEHYLTVSINLVDHVLELGFCRVLSQGPHNCSQLLGGDGAIAILVEKGECLLELGDLLLGKLVGLKNSIKLNDFVHNVI